MRGSFKRAVKGIGEDGKKVDNRFKSLKTEIFKFSGGLGKAGKAVLSVAKKLGPLGLAIGAVAGAFVLAGKAAAAMIRSVQAVQESNARLENTYKTLGLSMEGNKKRVEEQIQALQKLTGASSVELRDAFEQQLRKTGDVAGAMKALSAATEIAAASGRGLKESSDLLANAMSAGVGEELKKQGVIALSTARDLEVVDAVLLKLGGTAEAVGTSGGSQLDRFGNSIKDIKDLIFLELAPALEWALLKTNDFLDGVEKLTRGTINAVKEIHFFTTALFDFSREADVASIAAGALADKHARAAEEARKAAKAEEENADAVRAAAEVKAKAAEAEEKIREKGLDLLKQAGVITEEVIDREIEKIHEKIAVLETTGATEMQINAAIKKDVDDLAAVIEKSGARGTEAFMALRDATRGLSEATAEATQEIDKESNAMDKAIGAAQRLGSETDALARKKKLRTLIDRFGRDASQEQVQAWLAELDAIQRLKGSYDEASASIENNTQKKRENTAATKENTEANSAGGGGGGGSGGGGGGGGASGGGGDIQFRRAPSKSEIAESELPEDVVAVLNGFLQNAPLTQTGFASMQNAGAALFEGNEKAMTNQLIAAESNRAMALLFPSTSNLNFVKDMDRVVGGLGRGSKAWDQFRSKGRQERGLASVTPPPDVQQGEHFDTQIRMDEAVFNNSQTQRLLAGIGKIDQISARMQGSVNGPRGGGAQIVQIFSRQDPLQGDSSRRAKKAVRLGARQRIGIGG